MERPRWGIRILLGCWLAAIVCGPADGQTYGRSAQDRRPRTRVYGPYRSGATAQSRHFVGIMGAVAAPGVYEVESSQITLPRLIQSAGGLAGDAASTVKVVRDGRVAFQSYLYPGSPVRVQAGDVVFVGRTEPRAAERRRRATTGEAEAVSPVEIALVNLVDRPVVMRIRPEHASVGTMVSLLGQNAAAARQVRIVGLNRRHRAGDAQTLTSGSILVFDSRTIQREKIPPLPKPHSLPAQRARTRTAEPTRNVEQRGEPEKYQRSPNSRIVRTAGVSGPEMLTQADGDVPTMTQLRQFRKEGVRNLLAAARQDIAAGRLGEAVRKARHAEAAEVTFETFEDRPELVLAAVEKAARSRNAAEGGPATQDNAKQENPRLLLAPSSAGAASANVAKSLPRQAAETNGSPESITEKRAPDLPPVRRKLESRPPARLADASTSGESRIPTLDDMQRADASDFDSLLADANEDKAPAREADEATADWFGVRAVVGVIAVGAIFAVSWLLLSMGRKTTAPPKPPAAVASTGVLDRLIRDDLPVLEEPPAFPLSLEITAETPPARREPLRPKPRPRLQPVRIDGAQDVLRPHFQPRTQPNVTEPAAEEQTLAANRVEPPPPHIPIPVETAAETPNVARPVPPANVSVPQPPIEQTAEPAARVDAVADTASPEPQQPVPQRGPQSHDRHAVSSPNRRTMNRLRSSDALGRALSALRETSAQEGGV